MKINKESFERYFFERFGEKPVRIFGFRKLGEGAHGEGFLIKIETNEGIREYVLKAVRPEGLGHDYPSDRAGLFLLAYDTFNKMPENVQAYDVISAKEGELRSIAGGREYYLLMERAEGRNYFADLEEFSRKARLEKEDIRKLDMMVDFVAGMHMKKPEHLPSSPRSLYARKIRDIVGGDECLMGVFDTYPDGTLSLEEMARIEKRCVEWRAKLKFREERLRIIHGDFHPGNIWFRREKGQLKMKLLDRSRGPYGETADDLTALAINFIFFSIRFHDEVRGPYLHALEYFFESYQKKTGDREIMGMLGPFFAFRGAVVANPVFYPEVKENQRRLIFNFIQNVLKEETFIPGEINSYLSSHNIHKSILF